MPSPRETGQKENRLQNTVLSQMGAVLSYIIKREQNIENKTMRDTYPASNCLNINIY